MSKASIFDAVPEEDRLDLTGLSDKPRAAKPKPDKSEVRQDAEALGFTDRTAGKGRAAQETEGQAPKAAPAPAASVVSAPQAAPSRRILRSGRTVPINLKATADYQARFLAACDRLSEINGRGITQAEGFEQAVAALEDQISRMGGDK